MQISDRIQRLEDIDVINKLKLASARLLDDAVNSQASLDCVVEAFAATGSWECAQFGKYRGHQQLSNFLARYIERVSFSMHFLTGGVSSVSEDRSSAVGEWVVWQPFTLDREAWVLGGRSTDHFVQVDTSWRIASTHLTVELLVPWQASWGDEVIAKDWADWD